MTFPIYTRSGLFSRAGMLNFHPRALYITSLLKLIPVLVPHLSKIP